MILILFATVFKPSAEIFAGKYYAFTDARIKRNYHCSQLDRAEGSYRNYQHTHAQYLHRPNMTFRYAERTHTHTKVSIHHADVHAIFRKLCWLSVHTELDIRRSSLKVHTHTYACNQGHTHTRNRDPDSFGTNVCCISSMHGYCSHRARPAAAALQCVCVCRRS